MPTRLFSNQLSINDEHNFGGCFYLENDSAHASDATWDQHHPCRFSLSGKIAAQIYFQY